MKEQTGSSMGKSFTELKRIRRSFGRIPEVIEMPNLIWSLLSLSSSSNTSSNISQFAIDSNIHTNLKITHTYYEQNRIADRVRLRPWD